MQNKKSLYSVITTITVTLCLFLSSFLMVDNALAATQKKHRRSKKTTSTSTTTAAAKKPVDPRSLTRVQTLSVDVNGNKNAVELRYLNMPWGEKTFSYLEDGGSEYYSNRTWPFAHVKLNTKATYEGKTVEPGDYILLITPKNDKNPQMSMSLASVKLEADQQTFLVNGDVFTETPDNAQVITSKPVQFAKGAELLNALKIELTSSGSEVNVNMHYGTRTLTEKFTIN